MPTSGPPSAASKENCMRKSCVKPVEIGIRYRGNEQVLCTLPATAKVYTRVQTAAYTQLSLKQSANFPQAKNHIQTLLQSMFSPQSTPPINTITIHIN